MSQTYDIVEFLNTHPRPSKKERTENPEYRWKSFEYFPEPTTIVLSNVPALHLMIHDAMLIAKQDIVYNLTFGMAICHPEDEFVRRVGVEVANSKAQPMDFHLTRVVFHKTGVSVNLKSDMYHLLLIYETNKRPRLAQIMTSNVNMSGCNHE